MGIQTTTLLDGLMVPEASRWRDGKPHGGKPRFSDMLSCRVMTVDLHGNTDVGAHSR